MTTTVQWVFDRAMALMDELNSSTGSSETSDTTEYKVRTIPILNILRNECYPASDTFAASTDGKRAICPEMTSMTDIIYLDDALAQGVLPYGLAAHLLLDENPSSASFFQQRYEELLKFFRSNLPASGSEDIEDLYGGIGLGWFGRW